MGENIVGKCWDTGKVIVMPTTSGDYVPLHEFRENKISSIAAFPVLDPSTKTVEGVLSVDTKIPGYFSGKSEETKYIAELMGSFTMNLLLANYIQPYRNFPHLHKRRLQAVTNLQRYRQKKYLHLQKDL